MVWGSKPVVAKDFLFFTPIQTSPGPTQPPVKWILQLLPMVKQLGHGNNISHTSQ